jgi:hypothetical protein
MPRVDHDRLPRHPQRQRPLGQPDRDVQDVRHDIAVRDPVRPCPRLRPAGVRTHQAHPIPRGDLRQARIDTAPGVVQQIGPGLAHGPADLGPPRVHTDDHVREPPSYLRHEPDRPPGLLLGRDLLARSGLDPADVDDRGALGHGLLDAREGRLVAEGGALVVEGVRGAVHDRHDHRLVRPEFSPAQPEHPL